MNLQRMYPVQWTPENRIKLWDQDTYYSAM